MIVSEAQDIQKLPLPSCNWISAGEQRQHLQAIDIRAGHWQGMTDMGQWYIVLTLLQATCDKVLCSYCCVGLE